MQEQFCGWVEYIGNGWMSRCGVLRDDVLHEETETLRSLNPDAIRTFIEAKADERGFTNGSWKTQEVYVGFLK
jgi:hypothetical protein